MLHLCVTLGCCYNYYELCLFLCVFSVEYSSCLPVFSVNIPVDMCLYTFVSLYFYIFHFHQCFYLHLILHFLSLLVFLYILNIIYSYFLLLRLISLSLSPNDACNFIFTHQ